MTRQEVKDLKQDIINDILGRKSIHNFATNLQCSEVNLHSQSDQNRLSVGYSLSNNKFRLELMVYRRNGNAHRVALNIKQKVGSENVNIQIFNSAEIPLKNGEQNSYFGHIKDKPLHIGISISNHGGNSGTLGCFLRDDKDNYILSCNHVMARLGRVKIVGRKDDDNEGLIYHPGYSDVKGRLNARMRIGVLDDYAELFYSRINKSDSAIAKLDEHIEIDQRYNFVPEGYKLPFEGSPIYLFRDKNDDESIFELEGAPVYKIGKTTGLTEGVIAAVSYDGLKINVGSEKSMIFDNAIQVNWLDDDKPFSKDGDSGSLTFVKINDKLYSIGLVFSAGIIEDDNKKFNVSFVCNIKDILAHYPHLSYIEQIKS